MNEKPQILAAHWSATSLVRVLGPMQEFIQQSQSGGIVLLVATVVALLIANSPLSANYLAVLDLPIGITAGPLALEESLLHWVNDGLMAIFFFLVGLEIKREVLVGELANLRAAMLPIVAAVGGVMLPAVIYFTLNAGGSGARGWGVPMATDIAFALGCLALLGDRVPFGLKIFLTAIAIVDDLLAVLVIALFYTGGLQLMMLGAGLAVLIILALANRFGFRSPLIYASLGVLVWLAFLHSGVHATIAGVLVALTVPARSRIDMHTFLKRARHTLQEFEQNQAAETQARINEMQQSAIIELEEDCEQAQAPLQKMEHRLHRWVGFVIMPVFALANAGVVLSASSVSRSSLPVLLGIVLGLTLGKPIGIMAAAWLAVRAGIAELPQGVGWRHILGAGVLAGMGFTMSLFIASLAFSDPATLATAKLAILLASLLAGLAGLLLLRRVPNKGDVSWELGDGVGG
ncbi:MAG: Na+/H+ antiporter NhaA [Roseiflexaceae bacterium]